MGLLEEIKLNNINMELMEFKNSDDVTERKELCEEHAEDEYEIERDVLLNIMFEAVKEDAGRFSCPTNGRRHSHKKFARTICIAHGYGNGS